VSRRAPVVAALVLAVVAAAVVARVVAGDDDDGGTSSECAAAGVERPLPAEFPASFPLPPGTRVTQGAVSAAGALFAQGAAPMSAPEAVSFYRTQLARAGWHAAPEGEREAGVSAAFRGHGFTGTWTVDEVPGCPAAALLTLRFRRA